MTKLLLDVAIYQGSLKPAAVKAAGFTAVNLKISHGLSRKNVHPDLAGWIDAARSLGLGICTFHYMTADAAGEDQAEYAYRMLTDLGLEDGTAHQLDVESNPAPALASVRSYLAWMRERLGRPTVLYTGDWWWQPRGWDVSDLTPYVWAAPNSGYLGAYPGDSSSHWKAGYGGWPNLAVMQYAVKPLTGIDVSMSAIRDPAVWDALTETGGIDMTYAPDSCMAVRRVFQEHTSLSGAALGVVGDDDHAKKRSSYHLGKSSNKPDSYAIVESSRDRNGATEAASANDIGWFSLTKNGKTHNLRTFSKWLVAECKAGAADTKDIREIIYSPDGETVKRWDDLGIRSSGDDSHLSHTHISWYRDSENHDRAAVIRRYFREVVNEEDDMPMTPAERAQLVREIWAFDPGNDATGETNGGVKNPDYDGKENKNATVQPVWSLYRTLVIDKVAYQNRDRLDQALAALAKILANVTADDGEAQQIIAQIREAQEKTVADVLDGLGGSGKSDAEIAAALSAALGPRAAAVAALLR